MTAENNSITTELILNFIEHFPGEAAAKLEKLDDEEITSLFSALPIEKSLPVWDYLSPDIATKVLDKLGENKASKILSTLDPNKSIRILHHLSHERRDNFLNKLDPSLANELKMILSYPEDKAGALMDPRIILFRPIMTVAEALDRLRTAKEVSKAIYLVDDGNRLIGTLDLQDLALADRDQPLSDLMKGVRSAVEAMASREEVIEEIEQHHLSSIPVIDFEGVLIGVVRHDALFAAAKNEASSDLLTMVGASKDERALSKASFAIRKRLPWLQINLATAFLAASVVGLFEDTIAKYTALAVLLPVVAGQSGNTGAQALAVTMRGLALREIRVSQWFKVVFKEANVGLVNGIAVALTTALGVLIWSKSIGLALVIGISMVLSMVIAGIAGAAIPILLTVAKQDPAQSSSIVLTTVTDVAGFFSFLGIATLLASLL